MKMSPVGFPRLHKISSYDDFKGSQETAKGIEWSNQAFRKLNY